MPESRLTERPYHITPEVRGRLQRAFAIWTGDEATADDLTQDTLVEALRSNRQPDDPGEWERWTFGIARNVLLRHRRWQARFRTREMPEPEHGDQLSALSTWDNTDLAITDREVRTFLDQALGHLPPATRKALLLRYVDGLDQREAAGQLGISEGALESRIQRGKAALRTHLVTERPAEAISLGIVRTNGWVETNVWCWCCGKRHAEGMWHEGIVPWFICTGCESPLSGSRPFNNLSAYNSVSVMNELMGYATFAEASTAILDNRGDAIRNGLKTVTTCPACGGALGWVVVTPHEEFPDLRRKCRDCHRYGAWSWSGGIGMMDPAVHDWMIQQERTQIIAIATKDHQGRTAIKLTIRSHTSNDIVETFRDRETMKPSGLYLNGRSIIDRVH